MNVKPLEISPLLGPFVSFLPEENPRFAFIVSQFLMPDHPCLTQTREHLQSYVLMHCYQYCCLVLKFFSLSE